MASRNEGFFEGIFQVFIEPIRWILGILIGVGMPALGIYILVHFIIKYW